MILDEITAQIRRDKDNNKKLKDLYVFHIFGLITLFTIEPTTEWPIELRCIRGGLNIPNIVFEGYSIKPPYEFMLELFYFNKIDYLVKDIKKDNMKKLLKEFGFKNRGSKLSKNKEELVAYIKNKNYRVLATGIEKKVASCKKMYKKMVNNPSDYFVIDKSTNQHSKQTPKIKSKIKNKYLVQKPLIPDKSKSKKGKKSSADVVPALIAKFKNRSKKKNK